MTMLTYTVLTDPTALEASRTGQPSSFGTVYLVVTNTGSAAAYWFKNQVRVPVGNGAEHLTPDISTVTAIGEFHGLQSGVQTLDVQTQVAANSFAVSDPSGGKVRFAPGDYLVLKLEDVRVAETAGLAVLSVSESASRTPNAKPSSSLAAVPLVKTAAKQVAPSNFRPEQAMIDDGDTLVLRWDGPGDLAYTIGLPDGTLASVTTPGQWTPDPATGPKRDVTYTLIATDPNTAQQYFLTTTVQLGTPVFETGIRAARVQGTAATSGSLGFTADGVEVSNSSGGQGTLRAEKVTTRRVAGTDANATGFDFSGTEVRVTNNNGSEMAIVADRIAVRLVNAYRVQGRSEKDGSIVFPELGIQVCNGRFDNTPKYGYVFADSGIYQNPSFYGRGVENRGIDLKDADEVSVKHLHADGTTTYGTLNVSRVNTNPHRW
ncbi:hypothetical protein KO481_12325 [Nocardia sp. NEAU-G5]|uniref:Uncharacterized protein n=1 Tax=Nocardia albiluteola TaxID=2842303 RepID=A0ABS6AXR1_9NOCA|nr:hypothetical protein [Nocardia albiluteola]MBU3062310.1 hypothetical protein [Nocardia albiluteola]